MDTKDLLCSINAVVFKKNNMKKYLLSIIIFLASCTKNETKTEPTVSFFDNFDGRIWYYGYTYVQFTTEDYIQFVKNNGSQGSTFLNVCEVHDGEAFSRNLSWGDNINIYETGCENNYVELVRNTENELIYRSTYYAANVTDGMCSEMELQDLPTNPQLITWTVKNNVMTVVHENEESITTVLTLIDKFDSDCINQ